MRFDALVVSLPLLSLLGNVSEFAGSIFAKCNCESHQGMGDFLPTRWGAVMEYLYSAGRKQVDPRYCRTHAGVARLFASSVSGFNADAWIYIADAWSELASFKERLAQKTGREPLLPRELYGLEQSVHRPEKLPHQL